MPRYYFHIHDDMDVRDQDGIELRDIDAARAEAIAGGRELLAEQVLNGRLMLDHRIDIEDEQGQVVLTVPFRDLVEIEGQMN